MRERPPCFTQTAAPWWCDSEDQDERCEGCALLRRQPRDPMCSFRADGSLAMTGPQPAPERIDWLNHFPDGIDMTHQGDQLAASRMADERSNKGETMTAKPLCHMSRRLGADEVEPTCQITPHLTLCDGCTLVRSRIGTAKAKRRLLIAIDFDGVLHHYRAPTPAWDAAIIHDGPTPGAMEWLRWLISDGRFNVAVFSSRNGQKGGIEAMQAALWDWVVEDLLTRAVTSDTYEAATAATEFVAKIAFPTDKPAAFLTIDDRALTFDGDFSDLGPDALASFQPWNRRPESGAQAEPAHTNDRAFLAAVSMLVKAAKVSRGVDGRDNGLLAAIMAVETHLPSPLGIIMGDIGRDDYDNARGVMAQTLRAIGQEPELMATGMATQIDNFVASVLGERVLPADAVHSIEAEAERIHQRAHAARVGCWSMATRLCTAGTKSAQTLDIAAELYTWAGVDQEKLAVLGELTNGYTISHGSPTKGRASQVIADAEAVLAFVTGKSEEKSLEE
jgi:hypothetical protein